MGMSDDSMNILNPVKGLLSDFGIDLDYNMDHLKEADAILTKLSKHGIGKNNKQKISYARSMVKLAIDAVKLQEKIRKSFPGPKQKVKSGSGALSPDEVRLKQTGGIPASGKGALEYLTPMRRMLSAQDKYKSLSNPTFKEKPSSIFGRKGSTGELYLKYKPKGYELVTAQDAATLRQMRVIESSGRGTGASDNVERLIDTNAFYREASSTPSGMDFFPPVTAEQAESMRDEDAREQEKKKRTEEIERNRGRIHARNSVRRAHERVDLAQKYPAFKTFFMDSKKSTKDIHRMAAYLKGISKVPFIGGMIKADPISMGITAGLAYLHLLDSANKQEVASSKAVVSRENASIVYGKPPKSVINAGLRAGMSIEQITSAYGNMQKNFGGQAKQIYKSYYDASYDKPEWMKLLIAEGFGMSPNDMLLAEMQYSGRGDTGQRRKIAAADKLERAKQKIEASSANKWFKYAFPLLPAARQLALRTLSFATDPLLTDAIESAETVKDVLGIARSDDEYDSSGDKNVSSVTNVSKETSMATYINSVYLPGVVDSRGFIGGLRDMSENNPNVEVLDSMSNGGL